MTLRVFQKYFILSIKLNVIEGTIRRQRFTFREKAKQAKFYLAMYELVFEDEPLTAEQIIPIHNNAIYVDDRYLITAEEKQHIILCPRGLPGPIDFLQDPGALPGHPRRPG